MNDNPFAPPRDLSAPDDDGQRPQAGVSVPASPAFPAAHTREPWTAGDAGQDSSPVGGADDADRFPTPASPFAAPTEPPVAAVPGPPTPPRLPRRTVALIAAGALVLGGGAGFGGAWAFDVFDDSSAPAASSSVTTLPTSSGTTLERADETTVAAIAAAVLPSVVSIEIIQDGQVASEGSGFIIREDGYILTNNHVVADAGNGTVNVVMSDGSEHAGTVVGGTADYDLAVVQIDQTGLTPLVLGDSDALVVGDDVIAVGSPLGLEATVTTGIVSALHRPVTAGDASSSAYIDAIQTDAAINPGNSGGPLINSSGEVIGINSAIASLGASATSSGSVGLGFAIPSNQARRTAEELIATGEATYPVVGVILDGRYTGEGVMVAADATGVAAGGPAAEAGIEPGDIITAIDGRPITRGEELVVAIRAKSPGEPVLLTVVRDEAEQEITVTLVANTDVSYGDSGSSSEGGPGDDPRPEPTE